MHWPSLLLWLRACWLAAVLPLPAALRLASGESTSTATAEAYRPLRWYALVLADTGFEGKFSPFFAASSADQDVIDLTNIALLGADRKGEMILNGIEGETREYNGTDYTYHGPADCVVTENADGTVTYDIKLREDLKFSDGEPVTIDDVIFSMYVFLDPTYDGSATMYSTPIVGLDDYRSSMTTLSKLIAEAGEDNTDNSLFTAEQQKAFWDAVNDGGVKFAQEIIDNCVENGAAADERCCRCRLRLELWRAARRRNREGYVPELSARTTTGTSLPWRPRLPVPNCLT